MFSKRTTTVLIVVMLLIIGLSLTAIAYPEESLLIIKNGISNEREIAVNSMTLEEFQKWAEKDPTRKSEFDEVEYNCTDYSRDLQVNASKAGIRLYYAAIYIRSGNNGIGHEINFACFTDSCVLVEPQTNEIFANATEYVNAQKITKNWDIGSISILDPNEKFITWVYFK